MTKSNDSRVRTGKDEFATSSSILFLLLQDLLREVPCEEKDEVRHRFEQSGRRIDR